MNIVAKNRSLTHGREGEGALTQVHSYLRAVLVGNCSELTESNFFSNFSLNFAGVTEIH